MSDATRHGPGGWGDRRHAPPPHLAVIGIALALLAAGCGHEGGHAPTPPTYPQSGTASVGSTAPRTTVTVDAQATAGRVHLTDYSDSDSNTSSVILTGAVGDYGTGIRSSTAGSAAGNAQLELRLSRGTVELDITPIESALLVKLKGLAVDPKSCSASTSVSGTATIRAGSGTGAYAHTSGTFTLTLTLDEVYHPGQCNETAPYAAQAIVLTGSGTLDG